MIKTLAQHFADVIASQQKCGRTFPAIQIQEMERAFFAGAAAIFFAQLHQVAALPDDKAEVEMQKFHDELNAYFKMLGSLPPDGTERN